MIVKRHRAFTLIELMITMVVATILAAALLVALHGAQEEARDARTHAQVAKLNAIIAPQWESYVSRNVSITYGPAIGQFSSRERSLARLIALRDLMRMELPERITDLIRGHGSGNPSPTGPTLVNWGTRATQLTSVPHLYRSYIRRINSTYGAANLAYPQLTPNADKWSPALQDAECLYLIVATLRDEDSTGLDYFRGTEIADLDNDFMPELHDGWGHPIGFLRWAPGLESQIQQVENDPDPLTPTKRRPNRTLQPDHLDLLKVDPAWGLDPAWVVPPTWKTRATDIPNPGYLLFPLIYSPGRDGAAWIYTEYPNPNSRFDYTDPNQMRMVLDPYETIGMDANGKPLFMGSPQPADNFGEQYHGDNITNHLIEVK